MSFRRRPSRNAARALQAELTAAPIVAELRRSLLLPPDERVQGAHFEKMQLEREFVVRPPAPRRRARRSVPPPSVTRRVAYGVAAVTLAFASCGLNVANALPQPLIPLTHALERLVPAPLPDVMHPTRPVLGLASPRPFPEHPTGSATAAAAPATPTTPAAAAATAPSATPPALQSSSAATPPASGTHGSTTRPAPVGGVRPTPPPAPQPPPKNDRGSKGEPPTGFPSDWPGQSIAQARAALLVCSQSTDAAPRGCPQEIDPAVFASGVVWQLLSAPLAGATATVQLPLNELGTHGEGTQVTVYGRYQMLGRYTTPGDTTVHAWYDGGVAQATMTWDGTKFPSVTFATGSVDPPPGVDVADFARPAAGGDAGLLAVVQKGFAQCATTAPADPSTDGRVVGCPQHALVPAGAKNVSWQLDGDPISGAQPSFDAHHGAFVVTGTYSMTLVCDGEPGPVVTGDYTATIVFDGTALQLIDIAAS